MVSAIKVVTPDIVLVANDANASSWLGNVPILSDKYPGRGGLAGVSAALSLGRDVLVVAWDMPFVTADILSLLMRRADNSGADIVVPQSHSPYGIEPFCALYSVRIGPQLEAFLERGGGRASEFIDLVDPVDRIALPDLASAGDPRRLFFSINDPADLTRARAMEITPQ